MMTDYAALIEADAMSSHAAEECAGRMIVASVPLLSLYPDEPCAGDRLPVELPDVLELLAANDVVFVQQPRFHSFYGVVVSIHHEANTVTVRDLWTRRPAAEYAAEDITLIAKVWGREMNSLPALPRKYTEARRALRVMNSFIPNYRAEYIYRVLEARGYTWNEQQQRWVHEERRPSPR